MGALRSFALTLPLLAYVGLGCQSPLYFYDDPAKTDAEADATLDEVGFGDAECSGPNRFCDDFENRSDSDLAGAWTPAFAGGDDAVAQLVPGRGGGQAAHFSWSHSAYGTFSHMREIVKTLSPKPLSAVRMSFWARKTKLSGVGSNDDHAAVWAQIHLGPRRYAALCVYAAPEFGDPTFWVSASGDPATASDAPCAPHCELCRPGPALSDKWQPFVLALKLKGSRFDVVSNRASIEEVVFEGGVPTLPDDALNVRLGLEVVSQSGALGIEYDDVVVEWVDR